VVPSAAPTTTERPSAETRTSSGVERPFRNVQCARRRLLALTARGQDAVQAGRDARAALGEELAAGG